MNRALLVALLVATASGLVSPRSHRRLRSAVRERSVVGGRDLRTRLRQRDLRAAEPLPGGRPTTAEVALLLDLVAAALSAGLPAPRALQVAGSSCPGPTGRAVERVAGFWLLGAPPDAGWAQAPPELEPLRRVLDLVATAGVPGAVLLRSAADDLRRRDRQAAQARAESLGVRLVLPLGLCALPAFTAWAVVPVVLSLARQLVG